MSDEDRRSRIVKGMMMVGGSYPAVGDFMVNCRRHRCRHVLATTSRKSNDDLKKSNRDWPTPAAYSISS